MSNIKPGELHGEYENFTARDEDEIDTILMSIAVNPAEVTYIWVFLRAKMITIEPIYPDVEWIQWFTKCLQ